MPRLIDDSIFDGEIKRLGRALGWLEKAQVIAKFTAMITLPFLVIFISADFWQARNLYDTPVEKSFRGVKLELAGGGKNPPVIVLNNSEKRVFISTCEGFEKSVCGGLLSSGSVWVDVADVIEVSPGRGVAKSVVFSTTSGSDLYFNDYAESLAKEYYVGPYQKNIVLLIFAVGSSLLFIILKLSSVFLRRTGNKLC